MSDRSLRLLLIERERAALDAASAFELAERDVTDRSRALDLAVASRQEALQALEAGTRELLDAGTMTARSLEQHASRRASLRERVNLAKVAVAVATRELRFAEAARDEARRSLADAVERRRVVTDAIEARGVEAQRERASRDDDEADEANAARGVRNG